VYRAPAWFYYGMTMETPKDGHEPEVEGEEIKPEDSRRSEGALDEPEPFEREEVIEDEEPGRKERLAESINRFKENVKARVSGMFSKKNLDTEEKEETTEATEAKETEEAKPENSELKKVGVPGEEKEDLSQEDSEAEGEKNAESDQGKNIIEAPLSEDEINELRRLGVDDEGIERGKTRPNYTRKLIELSQPSEDEEKPVDPDEGPKKKAWEEMSDDEKQEKYGETFEIREKLHALKAARVNMVVLESQVNGWAFGSKRKKLESDYEVAKTAYDQLRAEYVGTKAQRSLEDGRVEEKEKAWRLLKEKQKVAETGAEKHQEGKFEKFRESWRKLGEHNLDSWLTKKGRQPESKAAKFMAKMVSVRTGISLGLLGGGLVLGAGTAVGISALAARRLFAGTATGLGSYDLLRSISEKRRVASLQGDIKDLKEWDVASIEEALAEREAQAMYSGAKILQSSEYQTLRREYQSRLEAETDREAVIKKALLDSQLELDKEKKIAGKREGRQKAVGIGAGILVGSGALAELIKNGFFPADTTVEEVQEVIDKGPALPADTAQSLSEFTEADKQYFVEQGMPKIDEELLKQAEYPDVTPIEQPPLPQAEIANTGELIEVLPEHVASIEKGSSVWGATRGLIESEAISEEDWAKAWANPNSMVRLPSGESIHISKLHLVHPGNQVAYIPAEGEGLGKFVLIGEPKNIGTGEQLAESFDRAGKPRPAWLEKEVGPRKVPAVIDQELISCGPPDEAYGGIVTTELDWTEEMVSTDIAPGAENLDSGVVVEDAVATDAKEAGVSAVEATAPVTEQLPERAISPAEAAGLAAEGLLEGGPTIDMSWGVGQFVYDGDNVASVIISESTEEAFLANREMFVDQSVTAHLESYFVSSLERGVPEAKMHIAMPHRIAVAREASWELQKHLQFYGKLIEDGMDPHGTEAYYLRWKMKDLVSATEKTLGSRIFKTLRFK
jgi:hypothetical protein